MSDVTNDVSIDTRPASSRTITNGTIDSPAVCPRCGKAPDVARCMNCGKPYIYAGMCSCGTWHPDPGYWKQSTETFAETYAEPVDIGWRCPGCQRVYAPDVKECRYCNDR